MNIGFFTEGGYMGKISRNHPNMRSDVSWICALGATHHPIVSLPHLQDNMYDIGIVIIPKTKNYLLEFPLMENLKRVCKKTCVMQESTYWYWQDNEIAEQIWYYNILLEFDLILCHNDNDLNYYRGMTKKPCEILPTVMIPDFVDIKSKKTDSVMIGGNFVSIYRGFDSYMVALEFSKNVWAPTTGRMKKLEKELDLNHLPWVDWLQFMNHLSGMKLGVQLGTPSAGSFNLNCSYLGIPCIGYDDVNTQKDLHPSLTVSDGDIIKAKELSDKLKTDIEFYENCSNETKKIYQNKYSEKVFLKKWGEIISKHLK